jgi:hypothetical protein
MTTQPPTKPPRIVFARTPSRKRAKAVVPAVAIPVRIVFAPEQKQRDAWKRFLQLTGQDE